MAKTLIEGPATHKRVAPNDGTAILHVAELFIDTIQGEGINTGVPATFLRLQGCTLDCTWCDSSSVWKFGNPYTVAEIADMLASSGVMKKLKEGKQHLILTGGSPLKQEAGLVALIEFLVKEYKCLPIIEVENEAVKMPSSKFENYVSVWNNSPKLANSGMKERARFKREVLEHMAGLPNSWFKFVVADEKDWIEIESMFFPYINRRQVILMPCGENQEELAKTRAMVADICVREGVRFSDRLHITIYDKMTGV